MEPQYSILFEPVRIGPVTAPNRFYQVPHCNGMGYRMPRSLAAMRGVKAEGGWGVVCTEEVEIHHSSDLAPCFEGRLWDDDDIPALALMAEAVHRHGALAGIELTHNGHDAPNYYSRTAPLGPRTIGLMGGTGYEPGQARRMDREDIRNLRRWHRAGRVEDIRECIGCNICVTGDVKGFPIRCTQNPTMGEEWRRGWHPETIAPKRRDAEILVVGAGPAGLECARALGQRGYSVALVEQQRAPGGRAARESRLPGLSEWRRVIDWRLTQIARLPNVTLYPGSPMNAADVLEAGYEHVVVATGADWRRDGVGRTLHRPIPGHDRAGVFTPDDLMADRLPAGRVVVYDDDHYYMGGVLAELLARRGCAVVLMTPAPMIAYWSQFTLEQERIQRRLVELGVELHTRTTLGAICSGTATLTSTLTGRTTETPCDAAVLVTDRLPRGALAADLAPARAAGQLRTLRVIGDAAAPAIIAQVVFSGHLAAREFDEEPCDATPFRIERSI